MPSMCGVILIAYPQLLGTTVTHMDDGTSQTTSSRLLGLGIGLESILFASMRSIVPLYLISPPPLTAPQIFISVRRYVYPYDRGSINLGADDGDVWNVRLDPPSFVSPACPPALPLMDCQVYDRNWNADRAAHLCDGMVLPRRADREYPHVNTADRSASRRGIADDRDRGGALPPRRYSVDGSLYRRSSHCLDMKSSKMLNHVRSGSESSHSA